MSHFYNIVTESLTPPHVTHNQNETMTVIISIAKFVLLVISNSLSTIMNEYVADNQKAKVYKDLKPKFPLILERPVSGFDPQISWL